MQHTGGFAPLSDSEQCEKLQLRARPVEMGSPTCTFGPTSDPIRLKDKFFVFFYSTAGGEAVLLKSLLEMQLSFFIFFFLDLNSAL